MTDATTIIPCHLRTVRGKSEPVVFVKDGAVFASSEDVAEYFGKRHNDVIRSINELISNNKICARNFAQTSRQAQMPNGGTRQIPTYNMDRDGFTLLAMGFTGKRALTWKLKYIEAFNAMEASLSRPQPAYEDYGAPAKPQGRKYAKALDRLDAGVALLTTAEIAMYAESMIDGEALQAIRETIEQARKMFGPARAALNDL